MTDKQLIRQITILERLPAMLLATISILAIIASLFVWIWVDSIVSLKMFIMGFLGAKLGMILENIVIIYVDKQIKKEINSPNPGKWESRMLDLDDELRYENQKKANTEAVKKIIKDICKN